MHKKYGIITLIVIAVLLIVTPIVFAATRSLTMRPGAQWTIQCSTTFVLPSPIPSSGNLTITCANQTPTSTSTATATSTSTAIATSTATATSTSTATATATMPMSDPESMYAVGAPWATKPPQTQPAGAPTPIAGQACPAWVHDRYAAQGPDGLWYPTWHPPVDPQYGCNFGHEHGDDPTNSPALRGHPVLFGYAPHVMGMTESHQGFKVSVWNALKNTDNTPNSHMDAYAVFVQHQGTSGSARFTMPDHSFEFHYYNPDDGRELHVDMMDTFSDLVVNGCGVVPTVTIHRTNGPYGTEVQVPGAHCYNSGPDGNQYEDWVGADYIGEDSSGNYLAYVDPHFAVFNPNTFCDLQPDNTCKLGYSDTALGDGQDPSGTSSWFKGQHRETYLSQVWVKNNSGSTTVWTDPYGKRVAPGTAGAIQQYISLGTVAPQDPSNAFGSDRNYDPNGSVHAPN